MPFISRIDHDNGMRALSIAHDIGLQIDRSIETNINIGLTAWCFNDSISNRDAAAFRAGVSFVEREITKYRNANPEYVAYNNARYRAERTNKAFTLPAGKKRAQVFSRGGFGTCIPEIQADIRRLRPVAKEAIERAGLTGQLAWNYVVNLLREEFNSDEAYVDQAVEWLWRPGA